MSFDALSGSQFHEMTREEFGHQPGTWFHGTPSGLIGGPYGEDSFHVGTKKAASNVGRTMEPGEWSSTSGGGSIYTTNPAVVPGRIVGEMTNTPRFDPRRGPATNHFEVREGVPWGALEDWKRMSPMEMHSDVRANAIERGARTSGRPLRRGFYYSNIAEGGGEGGTEEGNSVSAVLPNRRSFKTHEDYVIEARAQGKAVPTRVLKQYPHLGQQQLALYRPPGFNDRRQNKTTGEPGLTEV